MARSQTQPRQGQEQDRAPIWQCNNARFYMYDNGRDLQSGAVVFRASCGFKKANGEWDNFPAQLFVTKDRVGIIDGLNFAEGESAFASGGMKLEKYIGKDNLEHVSITVFVEEIRKA